MYYSESELRRTARRSKIRVKNKNLSSEWESGRDASQDEKGTSREFRSEAKSLHETLRREGWGGEGGRGYITQDSKELRKLWKKIYWFQKNIYMLRKRRFVVAPQLKVRGQNGYTSVFARNRGCTGRQSDENKNGHVQNRSFVRNSKSRPPSLTISDSRILLKIPCVFFFFHKSAPRDPYKTLVDIRTFSTIFSPKHGLPHELPRFFLQSSHNLAQFLMDCTPVRLSIGDKLLEIRMRCVFLDRAVLNGLTSPFAAAKKKSISVIPK